MPNALKKGVTAAGRKALLAAAAAADAADAAEETRRLDALRRDLPAALAPFERQALAALAAQPDRARAAAALGALDAELRLALDRAADDGRARTAALEAYRTKAEAAARPFAATLGAVLERTIAADKLDDAVRRAFARGGVERRMLVGRFGAAGALVLGRKPSSGGRTETRAAPAPFLLEPPFDDEVSSMKTHTGGVTLPRADADGEEAFASAFVVTYVAGGGWARAAVGEFVTIPAGFKTLEVEAKIRVNHFCSAGAVPGGAGAEAWAFVELVARDGSAKRKFRDLGAVSAPVFWVATDSGSDTIFVQASFKVPAAGGEMMLRAGAKASVVCGGVAVTTADAGADVKSIVATLS